LTIFFFARGFAPRTLTVVKALKKLDLGCVQAATAFAGGTYRSRFPVGFGQQAESLEIPEACREHILDQSGCQRCRRSPAAEADQGEGLGLATETE
jgi:hypothetical protein